MRLPGPMQRPEIFYLLDASASMQMGNPRSRWDESLAMIRAAERAGTRRARRRQAVPLRPATGGHRPAGTDRPRRRTAIAGSGLKITARFGQHGRRPAAIKRPVAPIDGDTRLQAALRQISSRFGRVPPQGIVVFSDGRVHDETGLEQIAAEFAKLKVPIHVVPVGDTAKGGDVAIAAVVAPPRVRKFTEVEVQVFVRSFGYDGKRSEVQLWELDDDGTRRPAAAPPLPITLQSGYQSVSLSFRTDLATRKLRVAIPALADEVSDRNNRLDTEMQIDRTKIRVLYVEGSPQPMHAGPRGRPLSDIAGRSPT